MPCIYGWHQWMLNSEISVIADIRTLEISVRLKVSMISFNRIWSYVTYSRDIFNPFLVNVFYFIPLKILENQWFFGVYRGYEMEAS